MSESESMEAVGQADPSVDRGFINSEESGLTDGKVLQLLRDAHRQHKSHVDSGIQRRWINSYDSFQNKHFKESKYHSLRWRGRSKHFRPKTRAAVRNYQAAAAAALFSTNDAVTVRAQNPARPRMVAAAAVQQHLLNYRLDRTSGMAGLPWFLESMAAAQDATITGLCVSKQYWEYRETRSQKMAPVVDEMGMPVIDETGAPAMTMEEDVIIERDRPMIRVFPIDQTIRDPSAHWSSQAQDGAYFGLINPMSVQDVEAMMAPDRPTKVRWREVSREKLMATGKTDRDDEASTRRARDGQTQDRYNNSNEAVSDYSILWATEWFFRLNGQDWHVWALGSSTLLSDPIPVRDAYPEQRGARPVVVGLGSLESHKVDPMSNAESWQPMQSEINDIVNMQLDALKQSISPVTKVVRGSKINAREIQNRSADSIIFVNKQEDIDFQSVPGPSQASFHQMDRLNADFDDLSGKFSGGSVMTNRSLNETVGGMNLLNGAANAATEFDLRVWSETWVEPVLRQVVNLESYFESDTKIIALAGEKAQIMRYGINEVDDELLEGEVTVSVNCGIGAADPRQRLMKLGSALEMMVKVKPDSIERLNLDEIANEAFGAAGYPDGGERFLLPPPEKDPNMMKLIQAVQALQKEVENKEKDRETRIKIAQIQVGGMLLKEEASSQNRMAESEASFGRDMATGQQQMDHEAGMMESEQDAATDQMERQAKHAMLQQIIDAALKPAGETEQGGAPSAPQPPPQGGPMPPMMGGM
jgi:hypothetical protein